MRSLFHFSYLLIILFHFRAFITIFLLTGSELAEMLSIQKQAYEAKLQEIERGQLFDDDIQEQPSRASDLA